jgi:hypothetical protein
MKMHNVWLFVVLAAQTYAQHKNILINGCTGTVRFSRPFELFVGLQSIETTSVCR